MQKIYEDIYQVWLLVETHNAVELLIQRENNAATLIVDVSMEDGIIFGYYPLRDYCYGNQKYYNEHIEKAIEELKRSGGE